MHDRQDILKRQASDGPVHRRTLIKPDGRSIMLYGYQKNDETPAADMLEGVPKATHMRWHPLRQEWSVYAAARQNRTYQPSTADDPLAPTLPGGPATEIPISEFEIAVFENRFPTFSVQPDYSIPDIAQVKTRAARGHCDVVVYTSEQTGSLATLSEDRRRLLIHCWIDRYEALHADGAAFVLPFENRGAAVGATLDHPHGQIYGFPIIPAVQANAAKAFDDGFDLAVGIGVWDAKYGIAMEGNVHAFAPPFARFPYEIWLAPAKRRAGPWEMTDEEITGFAHLLGDITRRYDTFFGENTPYMLGLHAAPIDHEATWHFSAQFYPLLRAPSRLKYLAAVEQSTGHFTVDVMPEETAILFRDI